MYSISANNITDAFYQGLEYFQTHGTDVIIGKKGKNHMKELSPVVINIKNLKERFLIVPKRNLNIFATIAETFWVLGGRNDVEFLSRYFSRAAKFSEDGLTWRASYGERLKTHFGVNQIFEAYKSLKELNVSNQANMVIFDPKEDLKGRKTNNPCTIWVHFAIRDSRLNTFVTMRANDIFWGFSHINVFEWSVIAELLAYWLGVEVGDYYQFNASWRIYPRHLKKCNIVMKNKIDKDVYSKNPDENQLPIDIKIDDFSELMDSFFYIENIMEKSQNNITFIFKEIDKIDSNYLKNNLLLLFCFHLFKNEKINECLYVFDMLYNDASKMAAAEYLLRKNINAKVIKDYFNIWNYNSK
jgi:thymidylate synthase